MKKVAVGNEVAFNMQRDAVWFTVEAVDGFTLTVRQSGTNNATQQIDRSLVKQVRKEDKP